MQTRQEAIQYCHSFQDVYEDYPFHDDSWCVMRHVSSWIEIPYRHEPPADGRAAQKKATSLLCCSPANPLRDSRF